MKIIVDTNILIQMFDIKNQICEFSDPNTGIVIDRVPERAKALIKKIENSKGTIIVTTPVLAELLIGIDIEKREVFLNKLKSYRVIEIATFDEISAIECAQLPSIKALKANNKNDTANKIRFDRQIISIAIAFNADEIWTHDKGMINICKSKGVVVRSLADIFPEPVQFDWTHEVIGTTNTTPH